MSDIKNPTYPLDYSLRQSVGNGGNLRVIKNPFAAQTNRVEKLVSYRPTLDGNWSSEHNKPNRKLSTLNDTS